MAGRAEPQISDTSPTLFFSIGTVTAYSAKYSALAAYKILELFQYRSLSLYAPGSKGTKRF